MIYWPKFVGSLRYGWKTLCKILENRECDCIISDGRFEIYNKDIPSFFISHQIRIMNPLRLKIFEDGSEIFNEFFFRKYAGVLIPDYKENNLSGDLSHNLNKIPDEKLHYVGVLSDFNKKNVKKDIDYLISISGPEPPRSFFEEKIFSQIQNLDGKIVVTLGKNEKRKNIENLDAEIHTFLNKEEREDVLNRAKIVVSRSGYSTIMDLAVIGTKALMTPTPGQIEQEYLSEYHNEKRTFYSVKQDDLDLRRDVEIAEKMKGIQRKCDVDETVEKIVEIVYQKI
jgi:hypothetical protein